MADDLLPGQVLRVHMYVPGSRTPLLRAGTVLNEDLISRLVAMDMVGSALASVFPDERNLDGSRITPVPQPAEPFLSPQEAEVLRDILAGRGSQTGLRRLVYDIAGRLEKLTEPVEFRVGGAFAKSHPLNVMTLSLAIARSLGYGPVQLTCLGTGALFHDIGKDILPARLLGKPDALTPEEHGLMRHHPTLGVAVLNRSRYFARWLFPREALEVIRFHHERMDGSGYPLGLAGQDIPRMAMIAAVADIYDAMVSDRIYARRKPPALAYQTIRSLANRQIDGVVVDAFLRSVRPYPRGTDVVLSDRRIARVLRTPAEAPLRPSVVVDGVEVDLAVERRLDIVGILVPRGEERIATAMEVQVQTREGQPVPGKTVNLSPDGACIDVSGDLPAGSHVEVQFFQGAKQVGTTRGNVCWKSPGGDNSVRMGIYAHGQNLSGSFGRLAS